MSSRFSTRIFRFRRKPLLRYLPLKPHVIISLFSTFAAEKPFYRNAFSPYIFQECSKGKALQPGRQAHARMIISGFKPTVFAANSLLKMYTRCSSLESARKVFDRMPERDCVSWNMMISGYASKGEMGLAQSLFDLMPERNVISWTSLMSGYSQNGNCLKSVEAFVMMGKEALAYDEATFAVMLKACASLEGCVLGAQVHGLAIKTPFHDNVIVANAILDMYGKGGALPEASRIFDEMKSRNVVSWNALICAYAHHGNGNEALQVFGKMVLKKVMPNHVTFVGVLCACAHSYLVDEAFHYLCVMQNDYGLEPLLEHYSCMVHALGRSGRINDALKLIEGMPLKAHDSIWKSVLSNCKMRGNVDVAEIAARSLLQLDPQDHSAYVLLSNVYAEAGMWDEAYETRSMISSSGLKKEAGCSWIEVFSL